MPKTELTKHLIADTLKQLAKDKHPDKISIGEIVDAAGLNRQTFYYHFQDKQDMIGWLFDADVAKLKSRSRNTSLIDDLVEYLYAGRAFYAAALTSEAQNSLREHIFALFQGRLTEKIILLSNRRPLDDGVVLRISRFFAHGLTGSLVQWAQEGMKYESVRFMQMNASFTDELLAFTVQKYTRQSP